ncbi:MAG: helix-turn-helix transcriptional regulator [Clostridiaceae bacterium]|nr:helix-turn-helix transcriptional regulator [Clostridiaceae bacterium]
MITFEPLWQTLKNRKITTYDLINKYNMSRGTLDNLKHDRSITLNTLNDICNSLQCDIPDVIKYTKDEK